MTLVERLQQRTPDPRTGGCASPSPATRRWAAAPSTSTSKKFGADYAYTVDGETAGEIENETFCADSATRSSPASTSTRATPRQAGERDQGRPPGWSSSLRADMAPEATEGRQGYVTPSPSPAAWSR